MLETILEDGGRMRAPRDQRIIGMQTRIMWRRKVILHTTVRPHEKFAGFGRWAWRREAWDIGKT